MSSPGHPSDDVLTWLVGVVQGVLRAKPADALLAITQALDEVVRSKPFPLTHQWVHHLVGQALAMRQSQVSDAALEVAYIASWAATQLEDPALQGLASV